MSPQRYAPQRTFPEYAFVPGQHPHPVSDPRGHQFGQHSAVPVPVDPAAPKLSPEFLFGVDLFNAGYYWEAHETWEGLWIAAGKVGVLADFLKGLIKLAAAGVKAREGQPTGVSRHARRAAELFQSVAARLPADSHCYVGLAIDELIRQSSGLAAQPVSESTPSVAGRPVLSVSLTLQVS